MAETPLSRFIVVGLVLLFISGCWMVGSLAVLQWRVKPDFFRAILLTTNALANISFLVSLLISSLGLTELIEEDRAKKATAYAFIAGIACHIGLIALFSWIVVSKLPWSAYD